MTEPLSPEQVAAYVDQAAAIAGLPIPPEYHASVVDNFARIAAIAQQVLEFPLPEELDAAPVFVPDPHLPE